MRLLLITLAAAVALAQDEPLARFHHLHLNATDPAAAIEFYSSKFDAEKGRFAGLMDAVWTQKSWMLFTKVASAPPSDITSAIWHFGWGAEDMKAAYQKQLDMGTKFHTPITELFPNFYFAYVEGPDKAVIELNTARHHHFGHLHLLSADPVSAAEWYVKHFGAKAPRPLQRRRITLLNRDIGETASLMMDNVNIILFSTDYAKIGFPELWKDRTTFDSPKGRVVDHVGFSVDNLEQTLARLRADGVKVTDEIRSIAGGKVKFAFIEGPDRIRIELVEGHARKE